MSTRADVKNVFHNAETAMFEADVTLHEGRVQSSYAVSVAAPITTEFAALRPALIRAAQMQHMSGRQTLTRRRLDRTAAETGTDLLDDVLFGQPRYLDQILARAA